MKISAYFHGVAKGASERKCRRIYDAYPNTRWVSTGANKETGVVCVTYDVPDASAKAISDLLVRAGFQLTPLVEAPSKPVV